MIGETGGLRFGLEKVFFVEKKNLQKKKQTYRKVNFNVGTDETCSNISPTLLVLSSWLINSMDNGFQLAIIISPKN